MSFDKWRATVYFKEPRHVDELKAAHNAGVQAGLEQGAAICEGIERRQTVTGLRMMPRGLMCQRLMKNNHGTVSSRIIMRTMSAAGNSRTALGA